MSELSLTSTMAAATPESLDSALLRVLMDNIPDRIYFKDLQSRFVRNNIAHALSLGMSSPEDCVGKTDFDFFSTDHAHLALEDEQTIIQTGIGIVAKVEQLSLRNGKQGWGSSTKMPWRDSAGRIIGTFGITRDITAAREAEMHRTEEHNLLRTIIDHLPSRIYVKDTGSRYLLNNKSHLEMLGAKTQGEVTGRTTLDFFPGERGEQALADDRLVLDTGGGILNQEKSDFAEDGAHWSLVTKVPLHDLNGELVGIVGISHDITRRKKAEMELQQRTAEMESDVRMARQVQESFLARKAPVFPRDATPATTALRFAYRYLAATTLGGDFFDFIQLSDTKCGVLVCDVMGHGVRAGLLTALVRGVVEEMGVRAENPAHVLVEINRSLLPIVEHTGQPVFATAFFGVIDLEARTLTYGNAGHPPPLVLRAKSDVIARLVSDDPEPATGLIDGFAYSRHACEFNPGDLLLAYTDGLIEAADATGRIFSEDRLRARLALCRGLPGATVIDGLLKEVEAYSGQTQFEDDVCVVAVEAVAK